MKMDLDDRVNVYDNLDLNRYTRRDFLGKASLMGLGILTGCGGGNSGGGNTMTDPNDPPNPDNLVTVIGSVEGFFNKSATNYTDVFVNIGGRMGLVDGSNNYSIPQVPVGVQNMSFNGQPLWGRIINVNIQSGGTNQVPLIDLIESSMVDLDFYNQVFRNNGGIFRGVGALTWPDGTVKWNSIPDFYVDKNSLEERGNWELQYLPNITDGIKNVLPFVSSDFFSSSKMIIVDRNNGDNLPEEGNPGIVVVRGGPADGFPAVEHKWIDDKNIIYSGLVELSEKALQSATNQDLGQISGATRDFPGSGNSLFYESPSSSQPVAGVDDRNGNNLYDQNRPAGTRSPDDTSHLRTYITTIIPSSVNSQSFYQSPDLSPNNPPGILPGPESINPNRDPTERNRVKRRKGIHQ